MILSRRFLMTIAYALVMTSGLLWAESGELAYVEGEVSITQIGGVANPAEIGDRVQNGDTLYTGKDGFAEIALQSGSTVTVNAGSVFNVGEVADPEVESRKRGFFRVLLGSVSFKFRNLTREPDVGTPLTVCSVRGTDFTVYAAPDGASMTVVSEGLVEVTSGEESQLLAEGEGVEAVVGLGLGETFDAKTGFVPFEAFEADSYIRMDDDPAQSMAGLAAMLEEFIDEGEFYYQSYLTNGEAVIEVREMALRIKDEQSPEAAQAFNEENMPSLRNRAADLNRTYRFYFISALMMRRHVMTNFYIRYRTKYLAKTDDPTWNGFEQAYQKVLNLYETKLIPLLEMEDL